MASLVTLLDLRTQVRDRADMKYTTFVTDSELNTLINHTVADLYDLLVEATEDYYVKSGSIVCDGLTDTYALPSDFYKLNGVDYNLTGHTQPMEKFVFEDRNKYIYNTNIVRYRIVGNNIVFKPTPAAQTITLWYTPVVQELVNDSDTFDVINAWDHYIVCVAAMKCLIKEESDVSSFQIEKQEAEKEIRAMSRNRDQGKPDRVSDVTGSRIPHFFLGDESWV